MDKITLKDKIRGSLLGGAIGDALGYPVEFMSRQSILKRYGNPGIMGFSVSESTGCAVISDDTQMTLFTATGLLFGITSVKCFNHKNLKSLSPYVCEAYKEWYQTQTGTIGKKSRICWIRDIAELNVRRAPGNTCMSALAHPDLTNNSKGCGGIMRVAPVAMIIASEISRGQKDWTAKDVQILAAECAAITHKHPMGYICAAVFADILFQILMCNDTISGGVLKGFTEDALQRSSEIFVKEKEQKECENLKKQVENAISLSLYGVPPHEAIKELGEGWTGDEALAISLFCAMRCINNFHSALICAVNHDGDSDSTGAICGNLMGAIVGADVFSFPDLQKLELKSLLLSIADDIAKGCTIDLYHHSSFSEEDKQWERRYIFGEDYITPFESVFMGRKPYKMLINGSGEKLPQIFQNAQTQQQKCALAYDWALKIFDTEKFCPNEQLMRVNYNEEPNFYELCKNLLPAYYWGFTDAIYSPRNNKRVFKLNVNCFKGKKNPIIAVRDDCGCQKKAMNEIFAYQLCAGLETFSDAVLQEKYPDWLFLKINFSTVDADGFAVFANQLEKDFLVEVAHLGDDGKLHRVYILNY